MKKEETIKDGLWVEFHDDGRLWQKGTYKDGKRDGYYDLGSLNGQLWWKGEYKDGKSDGPLEESFHHYKDE